MNFQVYDNRRFRSPVEGPAVGPIGTGEIARARRNRSGGRAFGVERGGPVPGVRPDCGRSVRGHAIGIQDRRVNVNTKKTAITRGPKVVVSAG